jgi:hypothetical protein
MNELAETLVDALLDREASVGATLTWNGNTYPCSAGDIAGGKTLGAGGYRVKAQATIVARLAIFPSPPGPPQEKQELTYTPQCGATPQNLKIVSATTLWSDVVVLDCDSARQA